MGSAALRSGEAAPVGSAVEERVRALVAEHLGVDRETLARDVSLTDDLAADSLDLLELGVVLEASFGIVVPLRTIDRVRTYGDLLDTVGRPIRPLERWQGLGLAAIHSVLGPPLDDQRERESLGEVQRAE